jgi:hypothetical protein
MPQRSAARQRRRTARGAKPAGESDGGGDGVEGQRRAARCLDDDAGVSVREPVGRGVRESAGPPSKVDAPKASTTRGWKPVPSARRRGRGTTTEPEHPNQMVPPTRCADFDHVARVVTALLRELIELFDLRDASPERRQTTTKDVRHRHQRVFVADRAGVDHLRPDGVSGTDQFRMSVAHIASTEPTTPELVHQMTTRQFVFDRARLRGLGTAENIGTKRHGRKASGVSAVSVLRSYRCGGPDSAQLPLRRASLLAPPAARPLPSHRRESGHVEPCARDRCFLRYR